MVTHPLRAMFGWPVVLLAGLILVVVAVFVMAGIGAAVWDLRRDRKAAREFKEDADV